MRFCCWRRILFAGYISNGFTGPTTYTPYKPSDTDEQSLSCITDKIERSPKDIPAVRSNWRRQIVFV